MDPSKLKEKEEFCDDKCNDLLIDIPEDLDEWSNCCIYRVPKRLRKVNEAAYTPLFVSIGPIHHGKLEFMAMEDHKRRYRDKFYERKPRGKNDEPRAIVKEHVEYIRKCYAGTLRLQGGDKFIDMIITDAAFIIELFLRSDGDPETKDYILSKDWLRESIELDLILLENQLPFFILEKLYNWRVGSSTDSFLDCASRFFIHCHTFCMSSERKKDQEASGRKTAKKIAHFTDLLRYLPLTADPTESETQPIDDRTGNIADSRREIANRSANTKLPSATKLKSEAGVEFEGLPRTCLQEVTFKPVCLDCSFVMNCIPLWRRCCPCLVRMKPLLTVPQIEVTDMTETILRNVMAFEQCHCMPYTYMCDYALLIDKLIDKEEDVDLLVERKVIKNNLGSNEVVAKMFNELSEQIDYGKFIYGTTVEELTLHYDKTFNRLMAAMTNLYFRDFWRSLATIVGLIILVFTILNFIRVYIS